MAFKPGHKLSKGRPRGALNRATQEARAILLDAGFCPLTAMMDMYKTALAKFVEETDKEESGRISPMESSAAKYLKIASDNASDLANYAHPKLKSIEQVKTSALDGMTSQEKLEAMKAAVRMLEADAKHEPGVT